MFRYGATFPWLKSKVKKEIDKHGTKKSGAQNTFLPVGSSLLVSGGDDSFIMSPVSIQQKSLQGTNNVFHSFHAAMCLLFSHVIQSNKNAITVGCPLFGISSGSMSPTNAGKQMNDALRVAFRYGRQCQLTQDNTVFVKNGINSQV